MKKNEQENEIKAFKKNKVICWLLNRPNKLTEQDMRNGLFESFNNCLICGY
jgi:hypothetical protein